MCPNRIDQVALIIAENRQCTGVPDENPMAAGAGADYQPDEADEEADREERAVNMEYDGGEAEIDLTIPAFLDRRTMAYGST